MEELSASEIPSSKSHGQYVPVGYRYRTGRLKVLCASQHFEIGQMHEAPFESILLSCPTIPFNIIIFLEITKFASTSS
jgi:hypothetical protein